MKLNEVIKKLRIDNNLSQNDVAGLLHMAQTAYGKLERGESHLTIERLYDLAAIFKLDVVDVINYGRFKSRKKEEIDLRVKILEEENLKLRKDRIDAFQLLYDEWDYITTMSRNLSEMTSKVADSIYRLDAQNIKPVKHLVRKETKKTK